MCGRARAGALDVNAKANWDWTPLHSAVEAGRKENGRRKKLQNGLRKQEWRAFLPAARLMISGAFVFRIYHRQEITLSLTWHEHDRSISSHPTPTPAPRQPGGGLLERAGAVALSCQRALRSSFRRVKLNPDFPSSS